MSTINILRNVVVDKDKIASLIKESKDSDLRELLDIKDSQIRHLRTGKRRPSANGLLRLLMMFEVPPSDLATVETRD